MQPSIVTVGASPAPRPAIVLVSDDGEADQVAHTIADLGYQVRRATGITDAVLLAAAPQIGAVLTALALCDGNWRDLVEQIRLRDRAMPVILCAKAGTAELWWDALENGVSDIIVSPYHATELQRVLAGSIGSSLEN